MSKVLAVREPDTGSSRESVNISFRQFKACTCGKLRSSRVAPIAMGVFATSCKCSITFVGKSPEGKATKMPEIKSGMPADLLVREVAFRFIVESASYRF